MSDSSQPASALASAEMEMQRIQKECNNMASLLKNLEGEELALRAQNAILAREVVNFGGNTTMLRTGNGKNSSVSDSSRGKQKQGSGAVRTSTTGASSLVDHKRMESKK